jgi:dTDP-4-dehydrorhamnose 3,5-epimerase
MIFSETRLPGVIVVELERHCDERGFFARTWCRREFESRGLISQIAQCSVSLNRQKGTLRGLHYQENPHPEAKFVRCIRGALYDVALDLRPQSSTYLQWFGIELTEMEGRALYIPEGCAHGFLTLEDQTEVFYQISEFFHPELSRGVRWNDPAFSIAWPAEPTIMSERDRTYPDFPFVQTNASR